MKQLKNLVKKIAHDKSKTLILALMVWQMSFPGATRLALADEIAVEPLAVPVEPIEAVPAELLPEVLYAKKVDMTAYSSTVDQTDSTPCITANGFNLCEHNQENVVAANFLKFGTKIRIPELYGDQIFTVQDRMNARYYYRVDLWKQTRQDAIQFGYKYATIEVLK